MTRRRSWTPLRRLAVFEAHGGRCHLCGCKVQVGERWELEHRIPLALGGPDDETNVAPAHKACHARKTVVDAGNHAKAERVRAKHFGAAQRRPSKWKRKVSGEVVSR